MKHISDFEARYILPTIEEKTAYGYKRLDPYTKLFEERIIFLGQAIDDTVANDVMAQLLTLESMDPDRDISIYINSPGGSFTALTAIYDTMQFIKPDVSTICVGMAASMGAMILSSGAKGKRYALPNSEIMIHQPLGGAEGQATDIEIRAKQMVRLRETLAKIMSKNTGQTPAKVMKDIDRDFFMDAEEAKKYGIIDQVLVGKK